MATKLQIGDVAVEVTQKDIKNVHLSVHSPHGRVSIAAPLHLSVGAIRAFAIGKLSWIRQQQRKLQEQERETPREYLERDRHRRNRIMDSGAG
jgi:predicted metal-dependent hydrolase